MQMEVGEVDVFHQLRASPCLYPAQRGGLPAAEGLTGEAPAPLWAGRPRRLAAGLEAVQKLIAPAGGVNPPGSGWRLPRL